MTSTNQQHDGAVVAHVFTPDQREHYDLESFYAAAEEVPLAFLQARPQGQQGLGQQQGQGQQGGSGSGGSGSSWTTSL